MTTISLFVNRYAAARHRTVVRGFLALVAVYFCLLFFIAVASVFGEAPSLAQQIRAYILLEGGEPENGDWGFSVLNTPEGFEFFRWAHVFPEPVSATLPDAGVTASVLAEHEADLEAERQAAKPAARKLYENQFFDLIDTLLILVDDVQEPTPKLGFPELQALIGQVHGADPGAAIDLTLNLLTIDAALKRYDLLWWDDAVRHDLGE